MEQNWSDFPGAPQPGTRLCRAADVTADKALCLEVQDFPLVLARAGQRVCAYINACPHQFLPLDYRSPKVLSADGKTLRCSNHEAGFDLATGQGVDGFGAGCALTPVPVAQDADGWLVIG